VADDRLGPIIEVAFNTLVSAASRSGYFDTAEAVEPKSAPGVGLTFACWLTDIRPIPLRSGLPVTSARVLITARIYSPMLAAPQERIDIELAKAASYLMAQLTGHFQVDGAWIDLLGAHGAGLAGQTGYVELDRAMFRMIDITVPFVCDDVFDQEA